MDGSLYSLGSGSLQSETTLQKGECSDAILRRFAAGGEMSRLIMMPFCDTLQRLTVVVR